MHAELRELAGDRDMNSVVIEALRLWVDRQRVPEPSAPQAAARDDTAVPAPVIEAAWSNAYRPPPRRLGA
jgi:hypothetical protein